MRFISISPAARAGFLSAAIVLGAGLLVGVSVYLSAAAALKHEVQSGLMTTARAAAELTDIKTHQQITRPDQRGGDLYKQVQTPYMALLKGNTDLAYIYTLITVDGSYRFIMDASLPKPGEAEIPTEVMEVYDDATDTLKKAFETRKVEVENETYTDKWGTFLSAYAPLYDNGAFVGIIGVDINAKAYLKHLSQVRLALALGVALAFIAAVIAGALTWKSRRAAMIVEAEARRQSDENLRLQAQHVEDERLKASQEAERGERIAAEAARFRIAVSDILSGFTLTADDLERRAEQVADIAADTARQATQAADTSGRAVSGSHQAADAVRELSVSIQEIARHSDESRQVAADAATQAEEASRHLRQLSETSARVGDVITIISDIASQINLLALNATIESARAGEAGRGFAVVATEVKNLSSRVASASSDITRQIEDVQTATETTARSVGTIGEIISRVLDTATSVAAAVDQQSMVTSEIATHIHASADGVSGIEETMQRLRCSAADTGGNAAFVQEASGRLRQTAQALTACVDDFASRLRAA